MLCALFVLGALTACSGVNSQLQLSNSEYGALPEPRGYVPDAGQLDFVYHSHETMTKFLR